MMQPTSLLLRLLLLLFLPCVPSCAELAVPVMPALAGLALQIDAPEALSARGPLPVAPQWSAAITYDYAVMGSSNMSGGVGSFLYDSLQQRHRFTLRNPYPIFHVGDELVQDQICINNSAGGLCNTTIGLAGQEGSCVPSAAAEYQDTFWWLQFAVHNGTKTMSGESCDIYAFEGTGALPLLGHGLHLRLETCLRRDGAPLELIEQIVGSKFKFYYPFQFHNVTLGAPDSSVFKATEACEHSPTAACAEGGVDFIKVWRIWAPPEPLSLANKNAGDVMGDLSFICAEASAEGYSGKLVTEWSIQVNTHWGAYSLCNYNGSANVCSGGPQSHLLVGRRGAQVAGRGPGAGQCAANSDIGSQFSFPAEAACDDGVAPSLAPGSCAWGMATPVRTVAASCIMQDRGLIEACKRDYGHAPFQEASAVFRKSFLSADPAQGGCPDVDPSEAVLAATIFQV